MHCIRCFIGAVKPKLVVWFVGFWLPFLLLAFGQIVDITPSTFLISCDTVFIQEFIEYKFIDLKSQVFANLFIKLFNSGYVSFSFYKFVDLAKFFEFLLLLNSRKVFQLLVINRIFIENFKKPEKIEKNISV